MPFSISRRSFLAQAGAGAALCAGCQTRPKDPNAMPPLTDLHVHLDNSTLDAVLALSKERGVKFGIVEHAGTRENVYPKVLSNDEELGQYLSMLEGKPVYKGIQAEWTDWMGCFSKKMLGKLDFILTDTWTFPDKNGKRMKLWEKTAEIPPADVFMDRYVDWHVQIMTTEPVDILANVSWLPGPMGEAYDTLWTEKRMRTVIDTALKHRVALEISSGFQLPKLRFLRMAKEAGIKFAFGTNGRYPKMGLLEYSMQMAKELDLQPRDIFVPAPDGQRAAQRRSY